MKCKKTLADNSVVTSTVYWKLFRANCPKINQLCSNQSKAYVAAITVCRQALWTGTCDQTAQLC